MVQHLVPCVWGNVSCSQLLLNVVPSPSKAVIIATWFLFLSLIISVAISSELLSRMRHQNARGRLAQVLLQLCKAGEVSAHKVLICCVVGFLVGLGLFFFLMEINIQYKIKCFALGKIL